MKSITTTDYLEIGDEFEFRHSLTNVKYKWQVITVPEPGGLQGMSMAFTARRLNTSIEARFHNFLKD